VENQIERIAMTFFGLLISVFSYRVILGGYFWVNHFETKKKEIEHFVLGNGVSIFSDNPHYTTVGELKKVYSKRGYISTRKTLKHLSFVSVLLWAGLLCYFTLKILNVII